MNYKPLIIVAGEPNSIFFEIFFKVIKRKIKSPIILIASKKLDTFGLIAPISNDKKYPNYKINEKNKSINIFESPFCTTKVSKKRFANSGAYFLYNVSSLIRGIR